MEGTFWHHAHQTHIALIQHDKMLPASERGYLGQMIRPCRVATIKDYQAKIGITASLTRTADAFSFNSTSTIAQSGSIHKGNRYAAHIHLYRDNIARCPSFGRGDDRITTRNGIQGG